MRIVAIISRKIYAALAGAVRLGSSKPTKGPSVIASLSDCISPSFSIGAYRSRVRMIPARSVPPSTATTDPLDHLVAIDRTKRPVTVSSLGPPEEPYKCHGQHRFISHLLVPETSSTKRSVAARSEVGNRAKLHIIRSQNQTV